MIQKKLHDIFDETMAAIFDPKADSLLSDAEIRGKKERYRLFNSAIEIPRIAQAVFGRLPEDFGPLSETSNAIDHVVYTMTVAVNGRVQAFICRINIGSIPETYLLAEELLYERWQEHSVPVPKVYTTRLRDVVFPYDFTVAERVGTTNLEAHVVAQGEEVSFYAYQAGAFLAQLHELFLPGFGHLSLAAVHGGKLRGVHTSWAEAVLTQLPETLLFLQHHSLISTELAYRVEMALRSGLPALASGSGVALHGDYHHANIVIDATQRRIVGVVDIGHAKVGDPLFDIAFYGTYYSDEVVAHFIRGYESRRVLPANWTKMVALYQLRILLSKIKLRQRFGYEALIPPAVAGLTRALDRI